MAAGKRGVVVAGYTPDREAKSGVMPWTLFVHGIVEPCRKTYSRRHRRTLPCGVHFGRRGDCARIPSAPHHLGNCACTQVLTLDHPNIRSRLIDEGKAQAKLVHPHIVPVRDVLEHEGIPALLMDFVPGPSLAHYLQMPFPMMRKSAVCFGASSKGWCLHTVGAGSP